MADVRGIREVLADHMSRPRVSVVIPAVIEERNLGYVASPFRAMSTKFVFVNGASTGNRAEVARRLWPDGVHVMQARRGKGNALACGFAAAAGDIIVMIDADGSTDPAEIPRYVGAGADYAKGSRFIPGGGSANITMFRRLANRGLSVLVNVLFATRFTDQCYACNAFWRRCLDVRCLPDVGAEEAQWGDGFEIETLINTRVRASRLKVVEVFAHNRKRKQRAAKREYSTDWWLSNNPPLYTEGEQVFLRLGNAWSWTGMLAERCPFGFFTAPMVHGGHTTAYICTTVETPMPKGREGDLGGTIDDVDVSVVMACYTEERLPSIRSALTSLGRQSLQARKVIVAVDNNAPLADLLATEFDWASVVLNSGGRGASATRNRGVECVDTTYTAFLDDDETADPDWLRELTRPFAEPDVVGTGGQYEASWSTPKPPWFPDEFAWVVGGSYVGLPQVTSQIRNVWSGNMAVRTAAFRQVGGFRTDFGKRGYISQPEDTDLCIRMAAAGGVWMYVPTAVIFHDVPASRTSLGFFTSRCYAEGSGKALMRKHLDSGSAIDTERDYARVVAVAALRRPVLLRWQAILQGLVILLGLACAGTGYVRGCLHPLRSVRRAHERDSQVGYR